jgi:hypothetical protein
MAPFTPDDALMAEIELDMLRWKIARDAAEDVVRSSGWSEEDEDFFLQIEEEAKRQWVEESEREFLKRQPWREDFHESLPDA